MYYIVIYYYSYRTSIIRIDNIVRMILELTGRRPNARVYSCTRRTDARVYKSQFLISTQDINPFVRTLAPKARTAINNNTMCVYYIIIVRKRINYGWKKKRISACSHVTPRVDWYSGSVWQQHVVVGSAFCVETIRVGSSTISSSPIGFDRLV